VTETKVKEPVLIEIEEITRNGIFKLKFNQELTVPFEFEEVPNSSNSTRREVISVSQIDVQRDLMDFDFLL